MKQSGPYDIDAVRAEWIGKTDEVKHGRYPVEYDAIRRHCHRARPRWKTKVAAATA